jgi:signal peptidase I
MEQEEYSSNIAEQNNEIPQKEKYSFRRDLYEWLEAIVYSLTIVILLFTFIFRIVGVDGASMEPTLKTDDRVIITHLFYTPKQGDIVVITQPNELNKPLIKRIVALGGQTVEINPDRLSVMVDGEEIDEPYILEPTLAKSDFEGKVTVPKGKVFVMGDNRNNSLDSRSNVIGFIDERYILGKAKLRIFPFSDIKILD